MAADHITMYVNVAAVVTHTLTHMATCLAGDGIEHTATCLASDGIIHIDVQAQGYSQQPLLRPVKEVEVKIFT